MTRKIIGATRVPPLASAALLALTLSACGSSKPAAPTNQAAQAAENSRVEQNNGLSPAINEQVAVEDSAVPRIEPFAADRVPDIGNAALSCSFKTKDATLLIAALETTPHARGKGVIRMGGTDRVLTGADALGAQGMRKGPTMTDGEFTVNVEQGSAGAPATLIVRMNMAHERRYGPGTWTCGK
ncbi:MAG: hypothetical protein ABIT09_01915 [Croceibacterium sp.]